MAVGQSLTGTANPLTTLKASKGVPNWPAIQQLINQWKPSALIVGKPLNMDGTASKSTNRAHNFSLELQKRFQLPIHEVDERLSTREARYILEESGQYNPRHKLTVDQIAAKLILESWMGRGDVDNENGSSG